MHFWNVCFHFCCKNGNIHSKISEVAQSTLHPPDAGFYALEVKNSLRIRPSDLVGLAEFAKDYPESRRVLLYRGTDRLLKDGILCLPVEDFLNGIRPDKRLEAIFGA